MAVLLPLTRWPNLEVKPHLRRVAARRHVVRAAEGREKVVQRGPVGQIYRRELQAPFVAVASEKIVVPDGQIKQMARRNARRIVVIILRSWRRYGYQRR